MPRRVLPEPVPDSRRRPFLAARPPKSMSAPGLVSWVSDAACVGYEADLFFPDPDDAVAIARAKAVCASCPASGPCRSYGLAHRGEVGIWGGLTEAERSSRRKG